jgi:hypothetical protein
MAAMRAGAHYVGYVFALQFKMELAITKFLKIASGALSPDRPDRATHPVCGPIQTYRNEPFGSPIWIGPLEIPLE